MTGVVDAALVRRSLGRTLKSLRQAAGLTLRQAADQAQVASATLDRLERGVGGFHLKDRDFRAILEVYRVSEKDAELILALAQDARNAKARPWWNDRTESIQEHFSLYVMLEDAAERIRQSEIELVPGLLQTRAYAEQLLRVPAGRIADNEIKNRVDVRVARQSLLTRGGAPRFEAVLGEAFLHRLVGGPDVMAEQLQHLIKVSEWPNVSLRVLPFSAGLHAGMPAAAPFTLLTFPTLKASGEPLEPPLAYVDALTGALYLQKPEEISAYEDVWADISERALDETASREMIRATLEGLAP